MKGWQINVLIGFFLIIILIAVLLVVSKDKYNEILSGVDKNTHKLKAFMPISLYLLDLIGWKYETDYEKSIEIKLEELYEIGRGKYYLKLFWAEKISLFIMVLAVTTLYGSLMEPIDSSFIFFMVTVLVLTLYLPDRNLGQKVKKRRSQIQIDFPDFLNKLVLLVNAGMTVTGAMNKICADRADFNEIRPLYIELEKTIHEIKVGKSEIKAYEDFAKRCRMPEVMRFISILIQNLKKGNAELVSILRLQSEECWHMRRNAAKILGEEADTKLLFPMMIMFIAILIIVIAPSVMQLQGF